jgi:hypothetical protein
MYFLKRFAPGLVARINRTMTERARKELHAGRSAAVTKG